MSTKKNDYGFGEFLHVHRLGEEMSQVAFAKMLGISKQRLCDIEKARGTISIRFAKKTALKLGLPPKWLVKLALQDQLRKEGIKLKVG